MGKNSGGDKVVRARYLALAGNARAAGDRNHDAYPAPRFPHTGANTREGGRHMPRETSGLQVNQVDTAGNLRRRHGRRRFRNSDRRRRGGS